MPEIQLGAEEIVRKKEKDNYQKYIDDPAVEKLAEQLKSPDARKEFFPEGAEMSVQNLDTEKLAQKYQNLAEPNLAL